MRTIICRDCGLDVPATTGKIPMRKAHGCQPNPGYIRRTAYERARAMVESWRHAPTDAGGRAVSDADKLTRLSDELRSLVDGERLDIPEERRHPEMVSLHQAKGEAVQQAAVSEGERHLPAASREPLTAEAREGAAALRTLIEKEDDTRRDGLPASGPTGSSRSQPKGSQQ